MAFYTAECPGVAETVVTFEARAAIERLRSARKRRQGAIPFSQAVCNVINNTACHSPPLRCVPNGPPDHEIIRASNDSILSGYEACARGWSR